MKLLRRNTTEFEVMPFDHMKENEDENGYYTGELIPEYKNPILKRGNISVPSGLTNLTFYGQDIRYTHILVMDYVDPDIREDAVILWRDRLYDIRAVRPSINGLSAALRQRTDNYAGEWVK